MPEERAWRLIENFRPNIFGVIVICRYFRRHWSATIPALDNGEDAWANPRIQPENEIPGRHRLWIFDGKWQYEGADRRNYFAKISFLTRLQFVF